MPEKKPQPQQQPQRTYAAETTATLHLVSASPQEGATAIPAATTTGSKRLSQEEQQALVDKLIEFLNKF